MNTTGFTLISAAILGAALSIAGAYLTIDNLIQPQGLLFEGLVLLGLGAILILLITVAAALGKTMITFADIMTKQAEIQKEMRGAAPGPGPSPLSAIIKNFIENPQSFTVQPMSTMTGFKIEDPKEESNSGLTLDELEKKLAEAIKRDDYESAEEINKEIKRIKRKKSDSDEEKNDE